MHYFYNRPYMDDMRPEWNNPDTNQCLDAANGENCYLDLLDPLGKVEDWYRENGTGPDAKGNKKEDRCMVQGQLDGDRIVPAWKSTSYGTEEWKRGHELSVFDADGDGLVENEPVDDPTTISTEYAPEHVQLHTVLHEMGHAVGMDENHTTDPTCLMYQDTPDWDRAGHFCPYARSQIKIHNQ
jgi:hypothetical protein